MPSPAGNDTPSSADAAPTAAKRPRLRSTKSELFIVNSELSRDTTDTDGSCDALAQTVGRTVTSLVTSDDSVDSTSVADMSQNSVTAGSADTLCQTSAEAVVDDHLPSADTQATALQVCIERDIFLDTPRHFLCLFLESVVLTRLIVHAFPNV